MEMFDFTLILDLKGRELDDAAFDALYDAGAADALIGQSGGVTFADFSRRADDILDAIVSAIRDIESCTLGAQVVRVEPDDIVTISDIARRMGRTDESIRLLIKGERGPGNFPSPATRLGSGRSRVWRWSDVVAWFDTYAGGHVGGSAAESWAKIGKVNDFLRFRRYLRAADPGTMEVRQAFAERLLGLGVRAHVKPHGVGWAVVKPAAKRSSRVYSSLSEAEAKACQIVMGKGGGEVVIHDKKGREHAFVVEKVRVAAERSHTRGKGAVARKDGAVAE